MRRGQALLPALLCAVGVTACHWVFPYAPSAGAQDGPQGDGPRHDMRTDGIGDTRRGPDLIQPDLVCNVEQDPNPATACPRPPSPGNQDGDGLPDARDPWPTACNPAGLAEPFSTPKWAKSWGRGYCDDVHELIQCGLMHFLLAKNSSQWVWTSSPSLAAVQPTDLVEVRFIPASSDWNLTLEVATTSLPMDECWPWTWWTPGSHRWCDVDLDGNYVTLKGSGTQTLDQALLVLPAAAVLQSYFDGGRHWCRLFVNDQLIAQVSATTSPLPPAATVVVDAVNHYVNTTAELDLDYVRIFR